IPASLTVLAKTVPTPGGPSVVFAISRTRGLNFGSFSPLARKANTSSMGRSMTTVALNSPAMRPPRFDCPWAATPYGSRRAVVCVGMEGDAEVVRRLMDAFNRGDDAECLELLDPDVEWWGPDDLPEAEVVRGHAELAASWEGWLAAWEYYRYEVDDIVEVAP